MKVLHVKIKVAKSPANENGVAKSPTSDNGVTGSPAIDNGVSESPVKCWVFLRALHVIMMLLGEVEKTATDSLTSHGGDTGSYGTPTRRDNLGIG